MTAWIAYSLATVIIGGGVLETTVYIPNWFRDIPASVLAPRGSALPARGLAALCAC